MLKALFKFIFKLLLLLVVLYGAARLYVVVTESHLAGERLPYVQMVTDDSVIIRWLTKDQEMGVVRYGERRESPMFLSLESSPRRDHRVELSGLKSGTRYYYHVGDINGYFVDDEEIYWFETAPAEPEPARIWVIGDSGDPGETVERVRDAALDWMRAHPLEEKGDGSLIDVWLSLGDIAYTSGSNKQYQRAFFNVFGDIAANTALWPTYGNHDSRRWTYFRLFDMPEDGEAGGVPSGTEHYYSFDYGDIHFIMLDSQDSDRTHEGDMMRWLKEDLRKNTGLWTIVAFHHPPYTKGSHDSDSRYDSRGRMQDMRENFLPVLEAAGVDIVLSGHSHMYERSYLIDCYYGDSDDFSEKNVVSTGQDGSNWDYLKPKPDDASIDASIDGKVPGNQGTIYVVAGSTSKVDQGPLDHPAHVVSLLEAGSVVIDVVGDTLTARFINEHGKVSDGFRISKQAGVDLGYPGCQPEVIKTAEKSQAKAESEAELKDGEPEDGSKGKDKDKGSDNSKEQGKPKG